MMAGVGEWDHGMPWGREGWKRRKNSVFQMRHERRRRKQWVGFPTTESGDLGDVRSQEELGRCGSTFSLLVAQGGRALRLINRRCLLRLESVTKQQACWGGGVRRKRSVDPWGWGEGYGEACQRHPTKELEIILGYWSEGKERKEKGRQKAPGFLLIVDYDGCLDTVCLDTYEYHCWSELWLLSAVITANAMPNITRNPIILFVSESSVFTLL